MRLTSCDHILEHLLIAIYVIVLRVRGALALLFIPAPIIARINCDLRERAKSTLASLIQALKFVFIFVPIAAPQFIGRQINILINVGSPWAALPSPEFPPPTRSIWEESKHDWLGLPECIEHLKKEVGPNGRPWNDIIA